MDIIGKIGLYDDSKDQAHWLMKIDRVDYKRCKGDFFRHWYISGQAIFMAHYTYRYSNDSSLVMKYTKNKNYSENMDYSKDVLRVKPENRKRITDIRKNLVEMVDSDEKILSLFDSI